MILRQSFDDDFEPLVAGLRPGYSGPPYAFARYADGEAAIMFGRPHAAKSDGWAWPAGKRSLLTDTLWAGFLSSLPGWHVGITAEEHHPADHAALLSRVQVPMSQVTLAEIFIFGNHERFRGLDLSGCHIVGPGGDFPIPRDAMATDWLWHDFTRELIERATRPILVAAGPLANAIIYDYWRWTEPARERGKRQVILDVGSAAAHLLHRRRIRAWQRPGDPRADWRPKWKV